MQELVCLMEVMVINAADTRIIARAFYADDGGLLLHHTFSFLTG